MIWVEPSVPDCLWSVHPPSVPGYLSVASVQQGAPCDLSSIACSCLGSRASYLPLVCVPCSYLLQASLALIEFKVEFSERFKR